MRRFAPFVLLLLATPTVLAHGEETLGDIREYDIDERFAVGASDFAELNFHALEGARISYSVVTNQVPVYFDVHAHTASGTVRTFVINNSTERIEGAFDVPSEGDYSLLVEPTEGDVEVRLQVQGTFAIESVHGFTVTEDSALPGASAVLLVASCVAALAPLMRRR